MIFHKFEKRNQALASKAVYLKRVLKNILFAFTVLLACLAIGVLGYHYTDGVPWIDALHNASMILSGMGPVVQINSVGGKLFSSVYALFSGVAFITNIGLILAPMAHRLFHSLNIDVD